MIFFIRQEQMT